MTTWEERVRPAVDATTALRMAMVADLDTDRGGYGWWAGYIDQRRVALLSEYLIASVAGVAESISAASLQATILREKHHADAMWMHQQWTQVAENIRNPSDDDFISAVRRGPFERRRSAEISAAREHAFFHLAQTMDRLAACVIGVAGLHFDIVRADWNNIKRALTKIETKGKRPLDDLDTEGRVAQEVLLHAVRDAVATGPSDWLEWTLRQRDTGAHRAPKMDWMLLVDGGQPPTRMVSPFYRQPGWSEVEAMVGTVDANTPDDLLIMHDPDAVVEGLVGQMSTVVTISTLAMADLWERRRSQPTLLIQPGSQWPKVLGQPLLNFNGFSNDRLTVAGDKIRVSPENSKRLQASKVMDHDRSFWRDE